MSSEALERARLAIKRAMECPDYHADYAQGLQREGRVALAALLVEVARLEQERDEAREQLQMSEADWARLTDVARAEAALAVAREREQRAVEALARIAKGNWNFGNARPGLTVMEFARAALVDEPAAAALAEPGEKRGGRLSAEHPRPSKSGSASAAADEPGETP